MGGHCSSCIDVIENSGKFKIVGLVAKNKKTQNKNKKYKVVGTDKDLNKIFKKYKYAHISIGQIRNLNLRKNIFNKLKKIGFKLPVIISNGAYVSREAKIGEGSIVMHNCIINRNAIIGSNSIINTKALIEHDCKISNHCHISTNATINGGVVIQEESFIGSNSTIKELVKIKKKSFIKAGSLVI